MLGPAEPVDRLLRVADEEQPPGQGGVGLRSPPRRASGGGGEAHGDLELDRVGVLELVEQQVRVARRGAWPRTSAGVGRAAARGPAPAGRGTRAGRSRRRSSRGVERERRRARRRATSRQAASVTAATIARGATRLGRRARGRVSTPRRRPCGARRQLTASTCALIGWSRASARSRPPRRVGRARSASSRAAASQLVVGGACGASPRGRAVGHDRARRDRRRRVAFAVAHDRTTRSQLSSKAVRHAAQVVDLELSKLRA